MRALTARLDHVLARLTRGQMLILSASVVGVIVAVDYLTGYEISASLFYLVPVAMAAWYAGRRSGFVIGLLSSVCWFAADLAAGSEYSHWTVPIWNALIRLGFFLVNGTLVAMLREVLRDQKRLASMDPLTGVFSRRAFHDRLQHDLQIARRNRTQLTVALLDLDNFKTLNDTYGHARGDQALTCVARALSNATRAMDTVARLGGDEFVLVLPETDQSGAQEVVSKLRHELRTTLEGVAPGVTCSIGVLTFLNAPDSADEAVGSADALMYQAKRRGRNTVTYGNEPGSLPATR